MHAVILSMYCAYTTPYNFCNITYDVVSITTFNNGSRESDMCMSMGVLVTFGVVRAHRVSRAIYIEVLLLAPRTFKIFPSLLMGLHRGAVASPYFQVRASDLLCHSASL